MYPTSSFSTRNAHRNCLVFFSSALLPSTTSHAVEKIYEKLCVVVEADLEPQIARVGATLLFFMGQLLALGGFTWTGLLSRPLLDAKRRVISGSMHSTTWGLCSARDGDENNNFLLIVGLPDLHTETTAAYNNLPLRGRAPRDSRRSPVRETLLLQLDFTFFP